MAEATLHIGNEFDVVVTPTKPDGTPALVDPNNPPTWANPDGFVTVVPAADGLSAVVKAPTGIDGQLAQVTVTADADLGDGVVNISATLDVTLRDQLASSLGLSVGPERPVTP